MAEVDNLGQIKVFAQVAEARSFTLAGRMLGISSSGVGKAIARLEERIGARLFHRNTRRVALTAEGAVFLERCQRILSELELAELELSQTQRVPRGKLHVSLPLVGMLMMPVLVDFMRRYPEIELDLDFTDRIVDLINEGFDLVIRTGNGPDLSHASQTLGYFGHYIVGAPAYLDRRGVPRIPADLTQHDCLHHKFPRTGKLAPWTFSHDGEEAPAALPRTVVANTIEPLIYMAEAGLGLAYLPDYAVQDQLARGTLQAVLVPYVYQEGIFRALWPSGRYDSPKVRLFVDFLENHLLPARGDE